MTIRTTLFLLAFGFAAGAEALLTEPPETITLTHEPTADAYVVTTPRERYRFARRPPNGLWAGELRLHEHDLIIDGNLLPSLRCGACDFVPSRQITDSLGNPLGDSDQLGAGHGNAQEVSRRILVDERAVDLAPGDTVSGTAVEFDVTWIGYSDRAGQPSASIAVRAQATVTAEQYRYQAEVTALTDQLVVLDYVGAQGAVTPCHSPPGAWEEITVSGAPVLSYGGSCPQLPPLTQQTASAPLLGHSGAFGALEMSGQELAPIWTRKGLFEEKVYWRPVRGEQRSPGDVDVHSFVRRFIPTVNE